MSWYWYIMIAEALAGIFFYWRWDSIKGQIKNYKDKEIKTIKKIQEVKNEKDPSTIDDLSTWFNNNLE